LVISYKSLIAHCSYFSKNNVLYNKSFQHRTFGAGQFLSRGFVVLLRKSIPQNHNLKTAAELGVM
jgi:hypothetical protein